LGRLERGRKSLIKGHSEKKRKGGKGRTSEKGDLGPKSRT